MRKLYDLAVKTREYTDRNGNTKANWDTVGSIVESDKGGRFIFLKKTFNPAGVPILTGGTMDRDSIIVSMFEPKNNGGGSGGGYRDRGNDRDSAGRDDRYKSGNDTGGRSRRSRQDDRDYPMDFSSYEEKGFDFRDGPKGGGRDEADVPF